MHRGCVVTSSWNEPPTYPSGIRNGSLIQRPSQGGQAEAGSSAPDASGPEPGLTNSACGGVVRGRTIRNGEARLIGEGGRDGYRNRPERAASFCCARRVHKNWGIEPSSLRARIVGSWVSFWGFWGLRSSGKVRGFRIPPGGPKSRPGHLGLALGEAGNGPRSGSDGIQAPDQRLETRL